MIVSYSTICIMYPISLQAMFELHCTCAILSICCYNILFM